MGIYKKPQTQQQIQSAHYKMLIRYYEGKLKIAVEENNDFSKEYYEKFLQITKDKLKAMEK